MNYLEMHQHNIQKNSIPSLQKWGVTDATQSGSFVEFTLKGVEFRLTQEQVRTLFDLPLLPTRDAIKRSILWKGGK